MKARKDELSREERSRGTRASPLSAARKQLLLARDDGARSSSATYIFETG